MKKIFGLIVVAFCMVSIMTGCSRENKESVDFNESMETRISEVNYLVDAAVEECNELVETINDFVETYNYENTVDYFEEAKDEITYWNEEIMDNGYTMLTLRDIYDNELVIVFDEMGLLYSAEMY